MLTPLVSPSSCSCGTETNTNLAAQSQYVYMTACCDCDPSNQSIKFEQIPNWLDPIFPCLSSAAKTNKHLICYFFPFLWFFCFFNATDIFWTIAKWNNIFLYGANSKTRRNWTLQNFCGNNKKRKFQKDITWLMEPSSDTNWCEPRDHAVMQPTCKDTNSRKAK